MDREEGWNELVGPFRYVQIHLVVHHKVALRNRGFPASCELSWGLAQGAQPIRHLKMFASQVVGSTLSIFAPLPQRFSIFLLTLLMS